MGRVRCPYCGGGTKRFGKTKAGTQRWRRRGCGATFTRRIDNAARRLSPFLPRPTSGERQSDMPGGGRTFRRRCAEFWAVWPLPPATGEAHRVAFVDGIRIARDVVVPIASTEEHVIGWCMARSEGSRSRAAPMAPIPPPDVVVRDGGTGFERARRRVWPQTRVQRCAFHAFRQVKRQTTTRPNLQAGVEPYGVAKALLRARDPDAAAARLASFEERRGRREGFPSERTAADDGSWEWTRKRLVTARDGLLRLVGRGVLLTSLDPELAVDGPLPSTSNRIEGGVNAQIHAMLRDHRGLGTLRRAKAVCWWCHMHTESPLPAAGILRSVPTDDDVAELHRRTVCEPQRRDGPAEWGGGLVWAELHRSDPWRTGWDWPTTRSVL